MDPLQQTPAKPLSQNSYTGIGAAAILEPNSQQEEQKQSQNQHIVGTDINLPIATSNNDKVQQQQQNQGKAEQNESQINGNANNVSDGNDKDQVEQELEQEQDVQMQEEAMEGEKADKEGNTTSEIEEDDDKSQNNLGQQQINGVGTTTRSGGGVNAQGMKRVEQKIKKPLGQLGGGPGGANRKRTIKSVIGGAKKPNTELDILSQIGGEEGANLDSDVVFQQQGMPTSAFTAAKNYFFVKQRFLYKPFVPLPNLQDYLQELIEVRVFAPYLTKFNKAYVKRNFYGTDIYTSDSDAVCILQHVNFFKVLDEEPQDFEAISVYFRVVKGRNNYPSSQRYGIRSRKMGQFDGHSLKFESAEFQKSLGSLKDLYQMSQVMPTRLEPVEFHNQRKTQLKNRLICSRMPDPAYKAINPALVFNLSLETANQYTLSTFADKSDDLTGRTCYKLQDNVLYLETNSERFEICKQPGGIQEGQTIKYRFSQVIKPQLLDNAFYHANKRPLEDQFISVIAKDIEWPEFQWGEKSLIVREQRYEQIKNYKYYAINEKR